MSFALLESFATFFLKKDKLARQGIASSTVAAVATETAVAAVASIATIAAVAKVPVAESPD